MVGGFFWVFFKLYYNEVELKTLVLHSNDAAYMKFDFDCSSGFRGEDH